MTIQITIIGLGEIGASIGLALRYQKKDLFRVGADHLKSAEEAAKRSDAVDQIEHNLPKAVKNADIVVLAIPGSELDPTLETIASELKADATVIDFSLNKRRAYRTARKYLAKPDQFISIHVGLNRAAFDDPADGWRGAREDLFKGGTLTIAALDSTDPEVLELAQDLAVLLGAHCAFADASEIDGLTARSELAPAIAAYAFSAASFRSSGWNDQRKFGGKPFYRLSALVKKEWSGSSLADDLLANREFCVSALQEAVSVLKEIRDALNADDAETLTRLIEGTKSGREKWLEEYEKATWRRENEPRTERVSLGDSLGQFFFGALANRKKKN